jgi:transketolase
MRNAFIDELCALAAANERIVLMVGDLGWSVVEPFADRFPTRFINAGVAEQNMTGMAAGMASEGFHVFSYSIANFPTFRCAEQMRNDVAYHGLPVTVVSRRRWPGLWRAGLQPPRGAGLRAAAHPAHMLIAAPG